jgi:hypothetical protein
VADISTNYQTTDAIETAETNMVDSTTVIQQSTSSLTATLQTDISTNVPTTGASSVSEALSVAETSTNYQTTDAIETTETNMVDSTTVILQGTSTYDSTLIEVHCI